LRDVYQTRQSLKIEPECYPGEEQRRPLPGAFNGARLVVSASIALGYGLSQNYLTAVLKFLRTEAYGA